MTLTTTKQTVPEKNLGNDLMGSWFCIGEICFACSLSLEWQNPKIGFTLVQKLL